LYDLLYTIALAQLGEEENRLNTDYEIPQFWGLSLSAACPLLPLKMYNGSQGLYRNIERASKRTAREFDLYSASGMLLAA
jgi:hypothetical protein